MHQQQTQQRSSNNATDIGRRLKSQASPKLRALLLQPNTAGSAASGTTAHSAATTSKQHLIQ
jgi:hypothetical protein